MGALLFHFDFLHDYPKSIHVSMRTYAPDMPHEQLDDGMGFLVCAVSISAVCAIPGRSAKRSVMYITLYVLNHDASSSNKYSHKCDKKRRKSPIKR